jgi:hypothetical protein
MAYDSVNKKAFELFLTDKKKKIKKSINIDNKMLGINKIDDKSDYIMIKAIYLWNNMTHENQQQYLDQVKDKINISYDLIPI